MNITEASALLDQRSFNARERQRKQAWLLTRVLALHQDGFSTSAMAERLGCHRTRIHGVLMDLGLTPNDGRRWP